MGEEVSISRDLCFRVEADLFTLTEGTVCPISFVKEILVGATFTASGGVENYEVVFGVLCYYSLLRLAFISDSEANFSMTIPSQDTNTFFGRVIPLS